MAETAFVTSCALVIVGAHLLYGSLTAEASLTAAATWGLLLAVGAALLKEPLTERALRVALAPAAGFVLVILFAALSLGNLIPAAGQPIWASVGQPAAATLDRSETLLEIVKLAGLGCAACVGLGCGQRDALALRTLKIVAIGSAIFLGLMILIYLLGLGPRTQAGRLEATFLNPNTTGTLAGAVFCLCLGLAMRRIGQPSIAGRLSLGLAGAATAVSAVALWLTHSRAAFASVAVALAGMLAARALTRRWTRAQMAMAAAGVAGGVLVIFIGSQMMLDRLSTLRSDGLLRQMIVDTHLRAFAEHPLMGYGLGSFDTVNRVRMTADTYAALWNIRSAENVYVQWLVEGGLLVAVPMFLTIGVMIATTVVRTIARRSMLGPLYGLLAADIVFLVHGIFDFALQTYSVALFWAFLLGLQLAWSSASHRKVFVRSRAEFPDAAI